MPMEAFIPFRLGHRGVTGHGRCIHAQTQIFTRDAMVERVDPAVSRASR